jgi:hypothetical protein
MEKVALSEGILEAHEEKQKPARKKKTLKANR